MKRMLIIYNQSIPYETFLEKNKLLLTTCANFGWTVDCVSNTKMFTFLDCNKAKCHSRFSTYNCCLFFDYDYALAKNLELVGVKVVNCGQAIEDCSNKASMYQKMIKNNINIPKTIILPSLNSFDINDITDFIEDAIIELHLPLVVKGWFGNNGENIYLARTKNDVYKIINHFKGENLLLQEYIAECSGSDIRIFVAHGKVISAIRRQGAQGDFRSNASQGGTMENYIPTIIDTKIAISATKAMCCDFAVVDLLKSIHGSLVCEVNPTCNINHFYDVNKINICEKLIKNLK